MRAWARPKTVTVVRNLPPGRLSNSVWMGDMERAKDHNGIEGYGDSINIKNDYTNS